jgi:hypothetical protein
MGVGLLVAGYFLGRSLGPPPVEFPDRNQIRSAAEMELAVDEALRIPRAFARTVTLVRLFEGLSADNVEGASRAVSSRSGRWDPIDLQLFLTAWVNLDPLAAMRAVEKWPIRSRRELGIKITIREWAASGGWLEAVDYLQTSLDPAARGIAAGPLVRGWALGGDFEGALGLARRLWASEDRVDVVDGYVRGVLHVGGPEGALEIARQIDPNGQGEFEQRLARVTLDLTVREDPAAAARLYDLFVAEGTPEWLGGTLDRLVGIWRNDDSKAVLLWLIGLERSATSDAAIKRTVAEWGINDFNSAWSWFEAEHGPYDPEGLLRPTDSLLLSGLLPKMARTRPVEASDWVTRLQPGYDRDAMLRRITRFWSREDPAAASRWIEELTLPPAERHQLRAIIAKQEKAG